jgi:hypothetical protein
VTTVDMKTGERVDPETDWAAMPPEERDYDRLALCGWVDMTVTAFTSEEGFSTEWTCPQCGGATFEWAHAEHPARMTEYAGRIVMYDRETHVEPDREPIRVGDRFEVFRATGRREGDRIGVATVARLKDDGPVLWMEPDSSE